jgi:hypothetical protein
MGGGGGVKDTLCTRCWRHYDTERTAVLVDVYGASISACGPCQHAEVALRAKAYRTGNCGDCRFYAGVRIVTCSTCRELFAQTKAEFSPEEMNA